MRLRFLALSIALIAASAVAQDTQSPGLDWRTALYAKQMLELGVNAHSDQDRWEYMRIKGYVQGIGDLMGASGVACYPQGAMTVQYSEVLLKFLHDHPERLHEPTVRLELIALTEAFPCQAK